MAVGSCQTCTAELARMNFPLEPNTSTGSDVRNRKEASSAGFVDLVTGMADTHSAEAALGGLHHYADFADSRCHEIGNLRLGVW